MCLPGLFAGKSDPIRQNQREAKRNKRECDLSMVKPSNIEIERISAELIDHLEDCKGYRNEEKAHEAAELLKKWLGDLFE